MEPEVLHSKAFSLVVLVSVAVATGMGCGGGLLLAVLGLVTHRGR
jgi:hypothetical protein